MKIGIDARVLEKKMTGVGRYLKSILNELPRHDRNNEYILLSKSQINFTGNFFQIIETGNNHLPEKMSSAYWLNFKLPGVLINKNIDLFFTPNHLLPVFKPKRTKTVLVVHDIFFKINKNFHPSSYSFYLKFLLPRSLKISDKIITVSHHTKSDIIKNYEVLPEKIKVLHEFADEKFRPMEIDKKIRNEILLKYNLPDNHIILYVGLIENRKNIHGILKIGDILYRKRKNITIILIGRAGFGFKDIICELDKRSIYVKHLNGVVDDELKIFYNLASVFLFPSYYEGFGLTPLEAMQSGIPVIASNNSALVEVVGEGGILHHPDNHKAFAEDIERLLDDVIFKEEMSLKALSQAQKFTNERMIKGLLSVFNDI